MRRVVQLADPPRRVPLLAQAAAVFGGAMQQIGWGMFCFSLIFVLIFGVDSEAITLLLFRGAKSQTEGQVVSVQATMASENEQTIYRVSYQYEVAKRRHEGRSYTLAPTQSPGDAVAIEYLVDRPARSRIVGLRARKFSAFVAFVFLFPIVGLVLGLRGIVHGLRARRLLIVGKLAYGRLIRKDATNTRINKQTVYKLTFEFTVPREQTMFGYRQAAGGEDTYQAVHKTHRTDELEDDPEEPLLYDPDEPARVFPIDGLPGAVKLNSQGQVQAQSTSARRLLLPAVAVVGLAVTLLWSSL